MVPCALRAWSETESRAFSSLSCASRGVCVLRCHLPCVPGDLAQCGQTGQQQEPHASAGRAPSAQAQEAPSEGRASPGAPWDAPGRCLQRGGWHGPRAHGLSDQGWAQSSPERTGASVGPGAATAELRAPGLAGQNMSTSRPLACVCEPLRGLS